MSRPIKAIVDYFPHQCQHGKSMYILENKFGNDGYAFWFKLLEVLGDQEHHYIDCRNGNHWRFLLAKTRASEDNATEILNILADLGSIDKELWDNNIIRSQNFIDNLQTLYTRRKINVYNKSELKELLHTKTPLTGKTVNINPQSKVKESKVKESIKLLSEREQKFIDSLRLFLDNPYDREMLETFYNYWTEPNKSKTKMRFELEKTWDFKRRLSYWDKNSKNFRGINGNQKRTKEEITKSAKERFDRVFN